MTWWFLKEWWVWLQEERRLTAGPGVQRLADKLLELSVSPSGFVGWRNNERCLFGLQWYTLEMECEVLHCDRCVSWSLLCLRGVPLSQMVSWRVFFCVRKSETSRENVDFLLNITTCLVTLLEMTKKTFSLFIFWKRTINVSKICHSLVEFPPH